MTCPLGMINPDCAKICPKFRRCEDAGSKRWLNEPVRIVPPRKRGKVKGFVENFINPVVANGEQRTEAIQPQVKTVSAHNGTRPTAAYGVSLSSEELRILIDLESMGESKWIADSL